MKWKKESVGIAHEDDRRALSAMFNGGFVGKQVKIIKIKKAGVILGNHYHHYKEMFYLLKGCAKYTLKDIETQKTEELLMEEGDRLTIEPKVAHKAFFLKDTIMIEATEKKYVSAEENDVRYEEW